MADIPADAVPVGGETPAPVRPSTVPADAIPIGATSSVPADAVNVAETPAPEPPPNAFENIMAAVHPYAKMIEPTLGLVTSPLAAKMAEGVAGIGIQGGKEALGEVPTLEADPTTGAVHVNPAVMRTGAEAALLTSGGELPAGAEAAFQTKGFLADVRKYGTPPPERIAPPQQYPNAATDGFDMSGVDVAPPPAPVVPPDAVPVSPIDTALAPLRPQKLSDIEANKLAMEKGGITPEQQVQDAANKAAQEKAQGAMLEQAKTRPPLSKEELYQQALQTQKDQQAAAATSKITEQNALTRRGQFEVIPGGKPPPPAGSVPQLPPDDFGQPTLLSPKDMSNLPPSPYSEMTNGVTATIGARVEPDLSTHTAVLSDLPGNLGALEFHSPAGVEQQLVMHGEKTTSLVSASKSDFPPNSITAKFDDLPLGQQEADRVSGGNAEARSQLRAAIDSRKLAGTSAQGGFAKDMVMFTNQGIQHYAAAIKGGVRVKPTTGQPFVLLNPGKYMDKLRPVQTKAAPRTTRTVATLSPVRGNVMEQKGFYLFKKGGSDKTGAVALDTSKLKLGDATALPWIAESRLRAMGIITPLDATKEQMGKAGIYFTVLQNNTLWEDTQRLLWKSAPGMYGPYYGGWAEEFINLLKRGLRIQVGRDTSEFIATPAALRRAAIRGVNLEKLQNDLTPGYTSEWIRKDKLTVQTTRPPAIPLSINGKVILRRFGKIAKIVMRKLNIKIDLNISNADAPMFEDIGLTGQHLGAFTVNPPNSLYPGRVEIYINFGNHYGENGELDTLKLLSTFGHEMGHMLVEWSWKDIPFPIQDQLMVAWDRMQLGLVDTTYGKAVASSGSIAELSQPGLNFPMDTRYASYWGGLHEFLARQIERHMMKELQYSGPSGRFFTSLSNRVRLLYKELQMYDPNFLEPTEAAREWVNYLEKQPVVNSNLGELTNASMEKSMKPSGNLALPGVEHPETGATVDTRQALGSIFGRPPGPEFDGAADAADSLSWHFRQILGIVRLARYNSDRIPATLRYVGVLRVWDAYKVREAVKREARMKEWNGLGQQKADKLARLLFYMTQQDYLSAFEKAKGVRRHPTQAEFSTAFKKLGITPDIWQVYKGINDDFKGFLDQVEALQLRDANSAYQGPALQAKLAEIQGKFANMRKSPYFPMTRFGQYAIWVRDSITNKLAYAELFESESDRNAAGERVRRAYPSPRYEMSADKIVKDLQPFSGFPSAMLEKIRDRLDLSNNPTLQAQFEALMFELGPEQSFKKHWLQRDGIPGFSQDAIRVYADWFMHGTSNLARQIYHADAQRHVNDIFAYGSTLRNKDRVRDIGKFFQDHLNGLVNPAQDYNMLRGAFFHMFLGFNPKSALMQMFQIPQTAWPHAMAVYGHGRGTVEISKAFARAARNIRAILTDTNFNEDPIKQRARARAIYDNVISPGVTADLANTASGTLSDYGRGSMARAVTRLMRYSGYMMTAAEKFGRHVAFDAFWELAGKDLNPKHVEDIINAPDYRALYNELRMDQELNFTDKQIGQLLAGEDGVRRTFFEAGSWARPPLLRGKTGLIFTFYTIMLNTIHFFHGEKGGAMGVFLLLLMAGYLGLPASEDFNNMIKQIAGYYFGKDVNLDRRLRSLLVDAFGPDSKIPEVAAHGLATESMGFSWLLNSMGLPFPRTDTSGSLTMGRLFPGAAEFNLRSDQLSPSDVIGQTALSAAQIPGAVLSYFFRLLYNPGVPISDPKRWEQAFPTSIKDKMRAIRMLIEGRERNRKGGTVVNWDMHNPQDVLDLGLLAIGDFQPEKLSLEQRNVREKIDGIGFYKAQKSQITQMLYQALTSQDPIAINNQMDKVKAYNAMVTAGGMGGAAIKPQSIIQGYKMGRKAIELQEQGLTADKAFIPYSQETERIYGGGARIIDQKSTR